jgi:two-component system, NarL family, sensor histidine kinase UhpB
MASSRRTGPARPRGPRRPPLLWLVFAANAAVFVVAYLLLVLSPLEISAPAALGQAAILLAGLLVLLAVNLVLLRGLMTPLHRLARTMDAIDPMHPGERAGDVHAYDADVMSLNVAFDAMLERLEDERRASGRRALAAQEGERLRLSRELHDEIGQRLTSIAIDAERSAHAAAAGGGELERIAADIRLSLDDVRRIARRLRPEALDDLGLVNALIALCRNVGAHSGTPVRAEVPGGLPPIGSEVELVLYRVAQEGVTNAIRHAGASEVVVTLEATSDRLLLRVRDDGAGLPAGANGAGIAGMRERALLVGAQLALVTPPGGGTEVRLAVPLEALGA